MTDLFAQLLEQYDKFREEHERLGNEDAIAEAQKLLGDIQEAGKFIVDPEERSILSSLAYDLGGMIFDSSGFYPSVRLHSPTEFVEGVRRHLRYPSLGIPDQSPSQDLEVERAEGAKGESPTGKSGLFIYGPPVQAGDFVDREGELRTIFNRIRSSQSTAVVGEPHIGKSSLLLKLADETTRWHYLGDESRGLVTSYLDLHSIGNDDSPAVFWERAVRPLRGCSDPFLATQKLEQAAHAAYTYDALEELFGSLHEQGQQLVLLLDEIERLLSHPRFHDFAFFATLRTLDSLFPSFSFVTTSRISLAELNRRGHELPASGGSPLFNTQVEVRLLPFDEEALARLLSRAGDALSHDDRHFVRRVAGRHPFLVQAMAATLLETTGDDRCARACERFYGQISSHFDELWNTLDDRTRATVVLLSLVELASRSLGPDFDYDEIRQSNALGPELRNLARLGLAEPVGVDWPFDVQHSLLWQGERWTIGAYAFAWWVCEEVIAEKRLSSMHSEWLRSQPYRSLLTQEQWDGLVSTACGSPGWMTLGIGALAQDLAEELAKRK